MSLGLKVVPSTVQRRLYALKKCGVVDGVWGDRAEGAFSDT